MKALILVVFLLLGGCDFLAPAFDIFKNSPSKTDEPPLYNYKADMLITVGGRTFEGIAVADNKPMVIELESKARLYQLTITTCGRHFVHSRADKNWFGGVGKKYKYSFTPNRLERDQACSMYIEAIDLNGTTAWGFIAFRTNETLPAKSDCNGPTHTFNGFTSCQIKYSIPQKMTFEKKITAYESSETCNLEKLSGKEFKINPSPGFCFITYTTEDVEIHRAIYIAYKKAHVRGD